MEVFTSYIKKVLICQAVTFQAITRTFAISLSTEHLATNLREKTQCFVKCVSDVANENWKFE